MLRLGAVVMKVSDVDRAAAFWSEALGYEKQPSNPAFLVPDDAPVYTSMMKIGRTSTSGLTMRPISRPKSSA